MRVVCLVKTNLKGGTFEIRDVIEPSPKENQVKIKVNYFGLNYADVMAGAGLYRDCPPLPAILGYECTGTVIQCGKSVDQKWLGKKVIAFTRFGAYAEFVCTSAMGIEEIPENCKEENALPLGTQYATAIYAATEMVNLNENDFILVHAAAGGVGTALTQIGKWKKCKIIALSGSDEKENYVRKNGADYFINYKKTDYVKEIKKITPNGIDVSFNAVAGKTFKKDKSILGVGGRIVLFGASERMGGKFGIFSNIKLLFEIGFYSPVFLMMKTQGIIGFNMLKVGDEKPEVLKRCLEKAVQLTKEGIFNPHTSEIFDATKTQEAHQKLASGNTVGKIGVRW